MARAIVRFWVVASTRAIVRVKIIFRSDVWVGLLLRLGLGFVYSYVRLMLGLGLASGLGLD